MKRLLAVLLIFTVVIGLCGAPVFADGGDSAQTADTREDSPEWVASLGETQDAGQLFIVAGIGKTTAWVSMHEKDENGAWKQIMTTPGFIGKYGLGKTKEGDGMTPVGTFGFNCAFGIAEDPGCTLDYRQVTEDDYWSGDQREGYHYNEMVSIKDLPKLNKDDSEHIVDYTYQYQYCLNISYNEAGTPGLGSAIFLHCLGPFKPYTGGCVAIPKDQMITVMQNVREDCVVVIDSLRNLSPKTWEDWGLGEKADLQIDYGSSERFTVEDRDAAIAVIRKEFSSWEGCELRSIRYAGDECDSEENVKWLNEHEGEHAFTECIEFLSDFRAPLEGGGAWEPGEEYTGWNWWLGRAEGGDWELVDSGY